jgi:hypothetical protein
LSLSGTTWFECREATACFHGAPLENISWDLAYKYLGVFIGPEAHCRRWSGIDRSIVQVASEIAGVSSSWQHAAFLYATYCISNLAYRLQFIPFDTVLKQLEARIIAKVTSTPMKIINNTTRIFLEKAVGKRVFPDLALLSQATMLRVWCKYDGADALFDKFRVHDLGQDDDILFLPPFPEWHASSIIGALGSNYRRHEQMFETITLNGRGLQGCIHDYLRTSFETELEMPLRIAFSLRKLGIDLPIAKMVVENLLTALRRLPLPVVASFVKAVVNGWTTSHRMGTSVGGCPFCSSLACDTLAHGLRCGLTSGLALKLLPKLALPREVDPLVVMLAGIPMPPLTVVGISIVIDCIHTAMMSARFGGTSGDGVQVAEARLRSLCLAYPPVRSAVFALR